MALLLWIPSASVGAQPANPPPSTVLTNFQQVLNLTAGEARKHLPVQARATVTLADPEYKLLFFQDETAGIFAYGYESSQRLHPGQILDLQAVSEAGKFSPILSRISLRIVGDGPLPPPRKVTLGEFASGRFDSQWVELEGVVRSESAQGGRLKFDLGSGRERVPIWVQRAATNQPGLVDCLVRVRGVGGTRFGASDQIAGFLLYVSSADDITVLHRPQQDVFERPVTAAREFSTYAMRHETGQRVHVRGVVTRVSSGRKLCLRDETGVVHLQTVQPAGVRSGERVEAAGFPVLSGETPALHDAVIRPLGPSTNRPAVTVPLEELPAGKFDHELVAVEGRLLQRRHSLKSVVTLLLESGDQRFDVCLPDAQASTLAELRPGSLLRVTGVVELDKSADPANPLVTIWLRTADDVTILAAPRRQVDWLSVLAFGLPGLAGCAGLGWLIIARQRRWRQIRREFEESQRELRDSLTARERMAQDLHDNVMQSVFAVGLGLEDCRRHLPTAPAMAEERLKTAISALNGSLGEIRRFIGGLEPQAISGHEFKTALKSLALTVGDSSGQFIVEVHPAATSRLTTEQATHLLNIAKEAMSNSLRHAKATKTVVALQPEDGIIRLAITDNGAGFDPASLGDQSGHGLRNIASRAREIGAHLQVNAALGRGTSIIVELPQTKL